MSLEFRAWPKIPRLNRTVTITEKIDGTNACVIVAEAGAVQRPSIGTPVAYEGDQSGRYWSPVGEGLPGVLVELGGVAYVVAAQSRTRVIAPGKNTDNFGFAGWVRERANELVELGPGYHYGEWYGQGIQRGYGLDERRFALFNTFRDPASLPACVEQVPVLSTFEFAGSFRNLFWVEELRGQGSVAVPGFMKPEGLVVYHHASKQNFKVLLDNDNTPKGVDA